MLLILYKIVQNTTKRNHGLLHQTCMYSMEAFSGIFSDAYSLMKPVHCTEAVLLYNKELYWHHVGVFSQKAFITYSSQSHRVEWSSTTQARPPLYLNRGH